MSRSVKLDYEKLQNPGNTRKLRVTVRRCRCWGCKKDKSVIWMIHRPDGSLFASDRDFGTAVRVANGVAKLYFSGIYGKGI